MTVDVSRHFEGEDIRLDSELALCGGEAGRRWRLCPEELSAGSFRRGLEWEADDEAG